MLQLFFFSITRLPISITVHLQHEIQLGTHQLLESRFTKALSILPKYRLVDSQLPPGDWGNIKTPTNGQRCITLHWVDNLYIWRNECDNMTTCIFNNLALQTIISKPCYTPQYEAKSAQYCQIEFNIKEKHLTSTSSTKQGEINFTQIKSLKGLGPHKHCHCTVYLLRTLHQGGLRSRLSLCLGNSRQECALFFSC